MVEYFFDNSPQIIMRQPCINYDDNDFQLLIGIISVELKKHSNTFDDRINTANVSQNIIPSEIGKSFCSWGKSERSPLQYGQFKNFRLSFVTKFTPNPHVYLNFNG